MKFSSAHRTELQRQLREMHDAGHPITFIARELGIGVSTVSDWSRELGLAKRRRTNFVTDELRARISQRLSRDPTGTAKAEARRLYEQELMSTVDIAVRLSVTPTTVSNWLKSSGVSMREVVTHLTRQKLRVASTGEKRWNWKGGITPEQARIRCSFEMRLARETCFKRDDYTCRCCQQRGGKLNAHHVWPFQRFPQWKYEVWNLVTLCKACHDKFHNAAGGAVHIAIGPFFTDWTQVREQPGVYEVPLAA